MTVISKAHGIVIKRMDHGNSSRILTLFTEEYGKIACIAKGVKSPKSKTGVAADLINLVDIVFYDKEHKEIQLVTDIELIAHYSKIKSDLEKLKYAYSAAELISKLLFDREVNGKLYRALVRLYELLNDSNHNPGILFTKFLLFFIKETGYEILYEKCTECGKDLKEGKSVYFNYERGFLCEECKAGQDISFEFSAEQFSDYYCLNQRSEGYLAQDKNVNRIIYFLENYLKYHVPDFKGIVSLHTY